MLSASQRSQPNRERWLGMESLLAVAEQIADAAPANGRVRRARSNVAAVMPATFTFGVRAGLNLHVDAIDYRRFSHPGLRGDENETQIILERAQQGQLGARSRQHHLRLQRGADLAGSAGLFALFGYRGANVAQPRPARLQGFGAGHIRPVVVGAQARTVR